MDQAPTDVAIESMTREGGGGGDSHFVSSSGRPSSARSESDPEMRAQPFLEENLDVANGEDIEEVNSVGSTGNDNETVLTSELAAARAAQIEAGISEPEPASNEQSKPSRECTIDEIWRKPGGLGTETQTKRCDKGEHICFDCFPIPDKLLDQLRNQTGLSKLACLQAVQTVVRFYKQDLVCSKYFANETTDDTYSEYSQADDEDLEESVIVFQATPTPVRPRRREPRKEEDEVDSRESRSYPGHRKRFQASKELVSRESESDYELKFPPATESMKLCSADKFRNMMRRLKLESASEGWNDPRNVSTIFKFYRKLNKVVASLDKHLLKRVVLEDGFQFMTLITNLLRKENRWSIQWEVIGIIGNIAARNSRIRRALMESDFPKYLKRVMLDPKTDAPKVAAFAELLTVLFSDGKPLPINLIESFDMEFVVCVLRTIEEDMSRPGWAIPDVLAKLLISYNLRFSSDDVYGNPMIMGLALMEPCKTFANRLIDWLDYKDTSLTTSWEVCVSVHQCVIKMTTDIFLCRKTSHIFSVAQVVILMRELLRSLSNFTAGDKRRTSYLKLIHTTLRHCKYDYIRNTPCVDNLEEILSEDIELSYEDQKVIRKIFKEFPQLQNGRQEQYF